MDELCWLCEQPHEVLEGEIGNCRYCGADIDTTPFTPLTDKNIEELNQKGEVKMANLNDLSEFLKKDDIKQGAIITFLNEGQIVDVDFSKAKDGSGIKKVFQIEIELPDGRKKIATINKTSQDSLGASWGKDTSLWVNKKAKVTFLKQLAFGKVMDVLVLEPVNEEIA